ncbi:hypothetical protein PPERSA_06726 [Pseudocohnilembus persalinus]|uniref:Uncharacterized protein n=1 Tax=Pseudocohnilembus persalinus TaxID=266149 RepID=A0A0V0QSA5_PSEPJ|nr:hypothetical protein PPERSA_06726 [Pseudocohnilembus persalinus]|eukprot:KRX05092.1 hypothetical protein PPERSA_06726 [Pseudocohnilembus persalinus]
MTKNIKRLQYQIIHLYKKNKVMTTLMTAKNKMKTILKIQINLRAYIFKIIKIINKIQNNPNLYRVSQVFHNVVLREEDLEVKMIQKAICIKVNSNMKKNK